MTELIKSLREAAVSWRAYQIATLMNDAANGIEALINSEATMLRDMLELNRLAQDSQSERDEWRSACKIHANLHKETIVERDRLRAEVERLTNDLNSVLSEAHGFGPLKPTSTMCSECANEDHHKVWCSRYTPDRLVRKGAPIQLIADEQMMDVEVRGLGHTV